MLKVDFPDKSVFLKQCFLSKYEFNYAFVIVFQLMKFVLSDVFIRDNYQFCLLMLKCIRTCKT